MKKAIRKGFKVLSQIEEYTLVAFLTVMMLSILLQVIFRFILNDPLLWSEELSRILLVWMGMAGVGYGIKTNSHVKLEYFFNRMPHSVQKLLQICFYVLIIAGFIILFPSAVKFIEDQRNISSSSLPIKYNVVFVSIAVGMVLAILHCIEGILNLFWEDD